MGMASHAMAQSAPAQAAPAQVPAVRIAPAATSDAGAFLIPDPWAGPNRTLYGWNHAVDHAVIAPPIHAYIHIVPAPVRGAVSNVVSNLDEPRVIANDILQLRFNSAGTATARFAINSTFGLAGLLDLAGRSGVVGQDADFGQTLGRYGVGPGPYLFVPVFGPSSIRDGIGRLVDAFTDPVTIVAGGLGTVFGDVRTGVVLVDARAGIDDQLQGLDRDFTDPYAALRAAYSQQRAAMVRTARGQAATPVESLPDFGPPPPAPANP